MVFDEEDQRKSVDDGIYLEVDGQSIPEVPMVRMVIKAMAWTRTGLLPRRDVA